MDFYQLLIVAAALESLWETIKMFWQEGKLSADRIGAAVLGIFLCVAAGVDFFILVELPLKIPYAGMVASGLIISRGSNLLHDFISIIQNVKTAGK